MARPLNNAAGHQPLLAPNHGHPFGASSRYSQPQYTYHPVAADFSIDADLTMADTYSPGLQSDLRTQLDEAAAMNHAGTHPGHVLTVTLPNAPVTNGMAPPRTPQQGSFTQTSGRPSVDETSDTGTAGDGSKRKRSKVSRACDECRRKKVKCDAAAEDGTIKTCTNCVKAGLTCEYSRIPMKRGPSKGYIKELSERVHQVESIQLALSNQPGFRQSLDAASNVGPFPDTMFAVDDPMSKRNFSFSDIRNPFAHTDFQRDRIPSVGAWGPHSPTASIFRPRDRSSLAIAPDQTSPILAFPEPSKPFWSEFAEPPSPKRRRFDDETIKSFDIEQEQLHKYYESVHPNLGLLPDADTVISILNSVSPLLQHAFAVVVDIFPAKVDDSGSLQGGTSISSSSYRSNSISNHFSNYDNLAEFVVSSGRENPAARDLNENLVYIWIYVLMVAQSDNHVLQIVHGPLPRAHLIRLATDLLAHLIDDNTQSAKQISEDAVRLRDCIYRARDVAFMLAKFHALAVGSTNFVSLQNYSVHTDSASTMSSTAAFLARISNIVAIILPLIHSSMDPQNQFVLMSKELILQQHLLESLNQTPGITAQSLVFQKVNLLFELLLSRFSPAPHAINILQPTVELADLLVSEATASLSSVTTYDPLAMPLFSITTITLLEFLADVPEHEISKLAEAVLNKLVPIIEQKAQDFQRANAAIMRDFYRSRNDSEQSGSSSSSGVSSSFWADCLVGMVEDQRKAGWASEKNNSAGGISLTRPMPDFSMLMKRGYLNVLVQWFMRARSSTS